MHTSFCKYPVGAPPPGMLSVMVAVRRCARRLGFREMDEGDDWCALLRQHAQCMNAGV